MFGSASLSLLEVRKQAMLWGGVALEGWYSGETTVPPTHTHCLSCAMSLKTLDKVQARKGPYLVATIQTEAESKQSEPLLFSTCCGFMTVSYTNEAASLAHPCDFD